MSLPAPHVPTNYAEWRHCITVECGIALTQAYIADRLQALDDARDYNTQRLISVYGRQHHQAVVAWFQQAAGELSRRETH